MFFLHDMDYGHSEGLLYSPTKEKVSAALEFSILAQQCFGLRKCIGDIFSFATVPVTKLGSGDYRVSPLTTHIIEHSGDVVQFRVIDGDLWNAQKTVDEFGNDLTLDYVEQGAGI